VTPNQIVQVGPRLVEFAERMLGGLPRSDQRAKGELYVRGLLTDGPRMPALWCRARPVPRAVPPRDRSLYPGVQ
jgi:hypothetical protein